MEVWMSDGWVDRQSIPLEAQSVGARLSKPPLRPAGHPQGIWPVISFSPSCAGDRFPSLPNRNPDR